MRTGATEGFCLPNEEKFGFLGSKFYNIFAKLPVMKGFHSFVQEEIMSRSPSSVLDIGFGTGEVMLKLCARDGVKNIFGLEPSKEMLSIASKKLHKCEDFSAIELKEGSSRSIPFDRKFDVIYSSLSFHHWEMQEESLRTIMQHLETGGSFLVFEFARESLRGYKKATGSHSLALADLEKFRGAFPFTVQDRGDYRCVEFKDAEITDRS